MINLSYRKKLFYLFIFTFIFALQVFAQYDGIQITTNESNQNSPAVWDSIIVWMDLRFQSGFTPDARIFMYDLTTETESQVYNFPYHQALPDISENRVVWQERTNIYMYDLDSDQHIPICEESGDQLNPKIDGNYIVWQDERNSSYDDIYLYDIEEDTTIQITNNNTIEQNQPDVSGNIVIWLQNDSLYYHDISEGTTQFVQSDVEIMDPAISGDFIVYRGYIDEAWQLFLYNIETDHEQQITYGDGSPVYPAISDMAVVWEDYRNDPSGYSNADIYLYDLATGTELPLCIQEDRQAKPAIWGNRVVWEDNRNGNNDIYMAEYDPPTGADLEVIMTDDPDPVEQDYYLNFTIMIKNNGPESAANTELEVQLPGNLEYRSIAASEGDISDFAASGTCDLGELAKGDTVIITLMVIAHGVDAVNTTAIVSSDVQDPNPANNTVTENTIVSPLMSKYFGHGWLPHIALDTDGKPDLSYTYSWAEGLLHYVNSVEGIGAVDIKYASRAESGWNKHMIYDGRWYSSFVSLPTHHITNLGKNSDIFIDKNDIRHVVYSYEHKDYIAGLPIDNQNYYLRYRSNDGSGWSSSEELMKIDAIVDRVIYSNGHAAEPGIYYPNIAIDSNGFVHITFMNCDNMATEADIYYVTNVTGDWENSVIGTAYDCLDMAIDKDDHLHLSFYDISAGGIAYLTNSPDGSWQTVETVEEGWTGVQMEGMSAGIAVDSMNYPHIVYVGQTESNNQEDIKYAYKNEEGWHIETVHEGLNQSAANSIAVDKNFNAHLCYFSLADSRLYYAVKSGQNWTKTVLDKKGKNWNDITVTPEGISHITYTNDLTGEDGRIYYVSNREFVDSDLDGIPDSAEQGPDGSNPAYDGDANGVPDYQQENASSFLTSDGENYITLVCDDSLFLSNVSAGNNPSSLDAPEGLDFPLGSISFTIMGLHPGDSASVQLILPAGAGIDSFYKYCATEDSLYAHWFEFMYDGSTGAVIEGNVITLHLIDGQRGDDDLTENGIIREPGVPAVNNASAIKGIQSPVKFNLSQNYPNPFNGHTRIQFSIPKTSRVELSIYNVLGQKIYQLVNDVMTPGQYNMIWDGKNDTGIKVASGLYFYRLKADNFVKCKKMLLIQ